METRYDRQIMLSEIGQDGQTKLENATVLVVGAGGLGSPVLQYLVAAGVGNIGVCDNDEVSISNLHRQILFTSKEIGENKAKVAVKYLNKLNETVNLITIKQRITPQNIAEIFNKYQIIVDCSDNLETKFLLHDNSYSLNKVLIQASIYQFEGQLHFFDFSNLEKKEKPCLRCLWNKIPQSKDSSKVGVLGIVPAVLGTLQANEVLKNILEIENLPQATSLIINLKTLEQQRISWKKNKNCFLCYDT